MLDRLLNQPNIKDTAISTLEAFNHGMRETESELSRRVAAFYIDTYKPSRDPLSKLLNRMAYLYPVFAMEFARIPVNIA